MSAEAPAEIRLTHGFLEWTSGVAIAIAGLGVAVNEVGRSQSSVSISVLGFCILAVGVSLLIRGRQRSRAEDAALPIAFVVLFTIGYGISSLVWTDPSAEGVAQSVRSGLGVNDVISAISWSVIGLGAFAVGFLALRFRALEVLFRWLRDWSSNGSENLAGLRVSRVVAIYAAGLLGRLVLIATGRFSYITADLQGAISTSSPLNALATQLSKLTTIGLVLIAFIVFSGNRSLRLRLLLWCAIVFEVFSGLLGGMRSLVLLALGSVLVVYVLLRGRVPRAAVFALFALIAVLSPLVSSYRADVRDGDRTTVGATDAAALLPSIAARTLSSMNATDVVQAPFDLVKGRLRSIDEVAMVVKRTGSDIDAIPVEQTLSEAVLVYVPRVIWPGKPIYIGGLTYARTYWDQDTNVFSSRSPTFVGEAYMRGGWLGVLVLMALVGLTLRSIASGFNPTGRPSGVPVYAALWPIVLNVETPLSLLPVSIFQTVLVTGVAMRWASSRRTSGPYSGVEPAEAASK